MKRSDLESLIINYHLGITLTSNEVFHDTCIVANNKSVLLGQYIYIYFLNHDVINYSSPIPYFERTINIKMRKFLHIHNLIDIIKKWNELFDIIEQHEESYKTATQ